MAEYLTQKMSSGIQQAITYYRKQKNNHASTEEKTSFTSDAKTTYAAARAVQVADVEVGTLRQNQGVPTGGITALI